MNLAKYNGIPTGVKSSVELGFYLGGGMQYLFTENIFLETGLDLSIKRSSLKLSGWLGDLADEYLDENAKAKINPIYFHIPIHVGYKFYFTDDMKLNLSAGPFMAFGLGGKAKEDGESYDVFGSDEGFKRFDFGLGLKVGLDINKINVHMGYDFGLINVHNTMNDIHTRNFYIGLAYNF